MDAPHSPPTTVPTDLDALDAALVKLSTDDAVLRMSETEAETRSGYQAPTEEGMGERMIMNMGPQHPSTHGVLRVVLELDGELITRSKPVIGYLHTGMEKTGEELTFLQGPTNVTRMDYAAPLFTELAFSLATEELLGIEVPERAQWIRMLMCEVNRLTLPHAVHGHQRHGPRCGVDDAVRLARARGAAALPGARHRPADEPQLHPPGWGGRRPPGRLARRACCALLDPLPERMEEFDVLMTGQPIWRDRLQGVGVITAEECLALGVTGPILRSTGYAWDLRRDMPYLRYDDVEFDVLVGTFGDCFDRYAIRLNEMRESIRIVAPGARQDALR